MTEALCIDVHADEDDEEASLRLDVLCVLMECHRDRGLPEFRERVPAHVINALASAMAQRLAPRIGGRYVRKGRHRAGSDERVARDAAVWAAFTGNNHRDVIRQFGISRRLLFSILARMRRKAGQA